MYILSLFKVSKRLVVSTCFASVAESSCHQLLLVGKLCSPQWRGMSAKTPIEAQLYGSDRLFVRSSEEFKLLLNLTYPLPSCPAEPASSSSLIQPHLFNFNRPKEEAVGSTIARIQTSINTHLQTRLSKLSKKQQHRDTADFQQPESHPSYVREICVLDASGSAIDAGKLCGDTFTTGHTLCLNGSIRYPVLVNPGLVASCKLTSQMLSCFPLHCDIQLEACSTCAYQWEISPSLTKPEWRQFSEAKCPVLPVDSANSFLRLTLTLPSGIQFQKTFGPVTEGISSYVSTRHAFTPALTSAGTVRVVTYNLLADVYANSDYSRDTLFNWCASNYLSMSYRKCLIFRELAGYNADLVTLQEVDESLFTSGGLPEFMDQCGFAGDRLMKLGSDGKPSPEGLALFYRRSRFELVENRSLKSLTEYLASREDLSALNQAVRSNAKFLELWEPRGQCAQVMVLRHVDQPDRFLCLCTTHLFWFPSANLVRLIQTYLVLHYLSSLKREYISAGKCRQFSLIFTGDFNSQPERGPYWLTTRGRLSAEHADWFSPGREGMIPCSELSHELQLAAAYEPQPFTNFTAGFHGHLDHIFYDSDAFRVSSTVPLPSLDQVNELTALPNRCYPSDHLALISDLVMI